MIRPTTFEQLQDSCDVSVAKVLPFGLVIWECGVCNDYWIPPLVLSLN